MAPLEFGTRVLVRAEVTRVIGTHAGDVNTFKQKVLDTRRYGTYLFRDNPVTWPGVAIPADWADTPPEWDIEPMPNGNAVVRFRRIALQTPAMGIYMGITRLAEGTLIGCSEEDERPWRKRELANQRWVDLWEIAAPPTRNGRGRITLVHPFDAQVVPLSVLA